MNMQTSTVSNEQILRVWHMMEDNDPDASTETIMQMVCDHFGNRIDHGDVADALETIAVPSSKGDA